MSVLALVFYAQHVMHAFGFGFQIIQIVGIDRGLNRNPLPDFDTEAGQLIDFLRIIGDECNRVHL